MRQRGQGRDGKIKKKAKREQQGEGLREGLDFKICMEQKLRWQRGLL